MSMNGSRSAFRFSSNLAAPYQLWEKIFDDSNMAIDWPLGPAVVDLNFVIDGDHLTLP